MLFENLENKKNLNKKYNEEDLLFNDLDKSENHGSHIKEEYPSISSEWEDMKERTGRRIENLSSPIDSNAQEERFKNSFTGFMMPKDTPERYRKQYSLSQEALDDVVGEYYNSSLKNTFEKNREASKKKGRDEYMRYVSVPGANPEDAYKASLYADNPKEVVDRTMDSVDDDYLLDKVSPLASYGGYDAREYVDEFVKPSLRDRMMTEYVKENTPKSSSEYIMRSAFDNSLIGKASSIGVMNTPSAKEHRKLASMGLSEYDSGRIEEFAAGVGSLLIDAPVFSGLGSLYSSLAGKVTAKATDRLAQKIIIRNALEGKSKISAYSAARKVVVDRLKNRILNNAATQGLTLGSYDLANSVADDILYSNTVNMGKAAGSFARGLATGAAVAAVGTPLKARSEGLVGGKKLLSSSAVLSAESAVFTLGTQLDKLAHGVEVAPIDLLYDFGESGATLLAMRMSHWRPKNIFNKLNSKGEIKDELKLSNSECRELRELSVDPDEFMSSLEKELSMPSVGSADARLVKEKYVKLMSNENLSASAKSKLMYLVENKVTSTPPAVFDYNVEQGKDGTLKFKMYDFNGGLVEVRDFKDSSSLKSYMIVRRGEIRRNRIAYYERELTSGIESQNFLNEAGNYAKENGVDANKVAEAMYKAARNETLDNAERTIMNELLVRSSRYESKFNRNLYEKRRELEQKYRLDRGTLSYAVEKPFLKCKMTENKALDEYEAYVRSVAESAREGNGELPPIETDSRFLMGNMEMKQKELEDYYKVQEEKNAGRNKDKPKPMKIEEQMIEVKDNKPGFVWNYRNEMIPEETIRDYEKRGRELAEKFGHDVIFITDEHQINVPENKDIYSVMDYNGQLRASGWLHKGKVFINLPNIKDYADLENTIVHEVVGHAGLKKIFGRYMYDFLEDVYKTSDKALRISIENMKNRYHTNDVYTLTEEYLVDVLEKSYPTAKERSLRYRFKDFVKSMLVRLNIYKPKYRRLNDEDVKSIMKAHCRYVLGRRDKSRHRKDVFGRFKSSGYNEAGYSDNEAYARDKTAMAKERSYMQYTPKVMMEHKKLLNYPYFPDDVKMSIRDKYHMSDRELVEQAEAVNYRFEGEKGARNKAKYYPEMPGERLEDAVDYESKGVNPYFIKNLTGWERGADGKWRKEVAETGGVLKDYIYLSLFDNNPELTDIYKEIKKIPYEAWGDYEKKAWNKVLREGGRYMKNTVLGDVVRDKEFFLSYPELSSLPVRFTSDSHTLARYDSRNKEIVIDRKLFVSPDADAYMSGVLQNVVQDYEGFSKAVSLRMLALEGKLANRYKMAQKSIALLDGVRRTSPDFDKDAQIERAFEREFGMDISAFKKMFPTYDDYLLYKLTGKNYSFSGDVEVNNVRKRYGYSNGMRRMSMAKDSESVPRSRQLVIENLDDLKKYFTGPLDVINDAMKKLHSDKPLKLKKVEERLDRARLTPVELAEFDASLDDYTKSLLREMIHGKRKPKDPYGYEKYKERMQEWHDHIRKKANEYREKYENHDDVHSGDDLN